MKSSKCRESTQIVKFFILRTDLACKNENTLEFIAWGLSCKNKENTNIRWFLFLIAYSMIMSFILEVGEK